MKKALLLMVMVVGGCCTNLQTSYVKAQKDFEKFLKLEIKTGHYKPDATAAPVLSKLYIANDNAVEVLKAEGKWTEDQ